MNLKDYWAAKFAGTRNGITKPACQAIGLTWPPYKGWLKDKGHIKMTPELIQIFERHLAQKK